MTALGFWQSVYIAVIRAGHTTVQATELADRAVANMLLVKAELDSKE